MASITGRVRLVREVGGPSSEKCRKFQGIRQRVGRSDPSSIVGYPVSYTNARAVKGASLSPIDPDLRRTCSVCLRWAGGGYSRKGVGPEQSFVGTASVRNAMKRVCAAKESLGTCLEGGSLSDLSFHVKPGPGPCAATTPQSALSAVWDGPFLLLNPLGLSSQLFIETWAIVWVTVL
ncbi:hypothetical protein BC827DRAFT_1158340 [Russula dissimulans]|nr:hypothetical protein BC827DRAFT_1158340 [Russula dissimulans]